MPGEVLQRPEAFAADVADLLPLVRLAGSAQIGRAHV